MNNLFKVLLIIILGAFLYLYYQNMGNNRYHSMAGHSSSKGYTIILLDTKTGHAYVYGNYRGRGATYNMLDIRNATVKKIE